MKKKYFSLTILIISIFIFTISGNAKGDKTKIRHKELGWWFNSSILKELNLNDKQAEQVKVLQSTFNKKFIKMGADLSLKKIDLDDTRKFNPFS